MTRRFRLVLSGACAALAALLCLLYGQHVQQEAERARSEALERYGGEVVSLVVATEGIEAGETVDRTNVAERDWIADLAPADALTSIESVLGSQVSVPAAAGVPLTALNFRDEEDVVEVPSGRMAISLPLTSSLTVPPGLGPGAKLAAYEVRDSGVRLLSEDLTTLAAPQAGSGISSGGALTVAVAPGDVAAVLAASGEGSLRLALPGDGALSLDVGASTAPTEVLAEGDPGGTGTGTGGGGSGGEGGAGSAVNTTGADGEEGQGS